MPTPVRAVRISDPEVEDALAKGKSYDLTELSDVIRLALKKLRRKSPQKHDR